MSEEGYTYDEALARLQEQTGPCETTGMLFEIVYNQLTLERDGYMIKMEQFEKQRDKLKTALIIARDIGIYHDIFNMEDLLVIHEAISACEATAEHL